MSVMQANGPRPLCDIENNMLGIAQPNQQQVRRRYERKGLGMMKCLALRLLLRPLTESSHYAAHRLRGGVEAQP
jgi:hypothetical protein